MLYLQLHLELVSDQDITPSAYRWVPHSIGNLTEVQGVRIQLAPARLF